MVMVVVVVVGE